MSIFYCSECDSYTQHEPPKDGSHMECDCGEQVIELSEEDLLKQIALLQICILWADY